MSRCACCGQILDTSTGRRAAYSVDDAVLAICNRAFDVAEAAGSAFVEIDHLVLALTRDGQASRILRERGIDPGVAARAAEDRVQRLGGGQPRPACDTSRHRPVASAAMQAALALAVSQAASVGHAFAGVVDLVEAATGSAGMSLSGQRHTTVAATGHLAIAGPAPVVAARHREVDGGRGQSGQSSRSGHEAWRVRARWAGSDGRGHDRDYEYGHSRDHDHRNDRDHDRDRLHGVRPHDRDDRDRDGRYRDSFAHRQPAHDAPRARHDGGYTRVSSGERWRDGGRNHDTRDYVSRNYDDRPNVRRRSDDRNEPDPRTYSPSPYDPRPYDDFARSRHGNLPRATGPDETGMLLDRLNALEAELAALRQGGGMRSRARRKSSSDGDGASRRNGNGHSNGHGHGDGAGAGSGSGHGHGHGSGEGRGAGQGHTGGTSSASSASSSGTSSGSTRTGRSSRSSVSFRSSLRRRRLGGKRVLLSAHPLIAERERTVAALRARRADRAAQSGLRFSVPDRASLVAANGDFEDDDYKFEPETDADDSPGGPQERQKRFYLALDDDIVKAPSIGPRTADRLIRAGLITVRDLLAADPDKVAAVAGTRFITARRIADWQAQARLVCVIPWLRGTHAQLLVGAGYGALADIVGGEPAAISAAILKFATSREGQSILRAGPPPDVERIHRWVENAQQAEPARAA